MISTIHPVTVMGQCAMTVAALLGLFIRYYSGNWSELSRLFKALVLSTLALATGASMFSLVYFLMYFPDIAFLTIALYATTILFSALIGSCCFGRLSVVKPRDDAWARYFKERNEWEEERRKRDLADED